MYLHLHTVKYSGSTWIQSSDPVFESKTPNHELNCTLLLGYNFKLPTNDKRHKICKTRSVRNREARVLLGNRRFHPPVTSYLSAEIFSSVRS